MNGSFHFFNHAENACNIEGYSNPGEYKGHEQRLCQRFAAEQSNDERDTGSQIHADAGYRNRRAFQPGCKQQHGYCCDDACGRQQQVLPAVKYADSTSAIPFTPNYKGQ